MYQQKVSYRKHIARQKRDGPSKIFSRIVW